MEAATKPGATRNGEFMKTITEVFLELKVAALASGKMSVADIKQITESAQTDEQRVSVLTETMKERGIVANVESAESHYSQKADDLLEKIATSGKVQQFQIVESLSGRTNAKERFEALQSLALAKHVIEVPRIARKNGCAVLAESDRRVAKDDNSEDIARVAESMKCSIREATIILTGKDPGPGKQSADTITERANRWKETSPFLTDAECRQLAEKGIEF
jgi:hypothetical protein